MICVIDWGVIAVIVAGVGSLATAWMAIQTFRSNRNAKDAILKNKQDSFINNIIVLYSNCRKIIEQMPIISEDCTTLPKPFGLGCLKYIYENLFKTRLTVRIDRSLPLSKQKEEKNVPEKKLVKETFENIVFDRYPDIGMYLSSLVSVIAIIDDEKTFDDIFKRRCIAYIKTQMSIPEMLWVYYFSMFGYDKDNFLNKYEVCSNIPKYSLIEMN